MAIIKQNVMGVFHGKVGTLTTFAAPAGNIARVRTNSTNVGDSASRTDKQQNNRVRWANLVNFYKASADWMKKAYENKEKKHSDYNQFMSVNFPVAMVALTKQEAAAGACVVQSFLVSQGSLPPVQVSPHGDHWDTNIVCTLSNFDSNTTVADFSANIIEKNNFVRQGMQLSFISYQQTVDDLGIPRVVCTPYELRIDKNNTTQKVSEFLPAFACSVVESRVSTGDNISAGGFAYVLSETKNGTTKVSTQALMIRNADLLGQYMSDAQYKLAIDSYGLGSGVFLDSIVAETKEAAPQPNYIARAVSYRGTIFTPGYDGVQLGELFGLTENNECSVYMANNIPGNAVDSVKIELSDGSVIDCMIRAQTGKQIRLSLYSTDHPKRWKIVQSITVNLLGAHYSILFTVVPPEEVE